MERGVAAAYIRDNFRPEDRLAAVLINRRTTAVIQRIAAANQIAAPTFQSWLRNQNSHNYDIYIAMNALHIDAQGRTKKDVASIRHIYLDFDENGTTLVEALLGNSDLPKPNYLIDSSPGKWQVVWKVEGFSKAGAEDLQKSLVRHSGADPAATDCSRVLRLPGFNNLKYSRPHMVGVQQLCSETYQPDAFCRIPRSAVYTVNSSRPTVGAIPQRLHGREPSQSERDWAYAKRALSRGASAAMVMAAIANYRRHDKHNSKYYAHLTVQKALQSLNAQQDRRSASAADRDR